MRAQTALSCIVELSWKERIANRSITPPSTNFYTHKNEKKGRALTSYSYIFQGFMHHES